MNPYGPFFDEEELRISDAPQEVKDKMYLLVKLGTS